jgi:hypothetical protein
MLYDASIHVLLVCSIVQLLSVAFEVSIDTLFDAMKQQYEYRISSYKYRYSDKKTKQFLVLAYQLLSYLVSANYLGNDNQP